MVRPPLRAPRRSSTPQQVRAAGCQRDILCAQKFRQVRQNVSAAMAFKSERSQAAWSQQRLAGCCVLCSRLRTGAGVVASAGGWQCRACTGGVGGSLIALKAPGGHVALTRGLHYDVQRLGRSLRLPPRPHLAATAAQTCLTASSGSVTHVPIVSAPRQPRPAGCSIW